MTTVITATFDWNYGATAESVHFSKQRPGLLSLSYHISQNPNNVHGGIVRHEYDKNNFVLFRLSDHIDRLIQQASKKQLGGGNFSRQDLIDGCIGVAQLNAENNYIRPLIYKAPQYTGATIVSEKLEAQKNTDYVSFSGILELDGYMNNYQNLLSKMALVDRRSNKLIVSRENYGIALETIIIVAQNTLRLKIDRRDKITLDDIQRAEELFLCETKTGILPVTTVKLKSYSYDIDDGFVGETTKTLINLYNKVASGQLPDYHRWYTIVPKTFLAQKNNFLPGKYYSDT